LRLFTLYFLSGNFLIQARKQKKEYVTRINEISDRYIKQDFPITWWFEESYLGYKDYQYEIKTNWTAFSHFSIKEKVLYMFVTDIQSAYSINEGEIGPDVFNELTEFVRRKIKMPTNTPLVVDSNASQKR